jgi:hypothetical protein
MIDRRELDFLDKLAKDALFSTGRKLSYNQILRALIDFAMDLGVSGEKINSFEAFKHAMLQQAEVIIHRNPS